MKGKLLLLALLCATCVTWAQRTPLHPADIKQGTNDLYTILDAWEPGTPPPGTDEFDDQFYISRVRPLKRLAAEDDYQVDPTLDPKRKLMLWLPLDDPSTVWKALPRYCFEGDNFGLWSYADIHGNWTAPWIRVSAGISDVAHKNGVKVGAVYNIPWSASVAATEYNTSGKVFFRMFQKNTDGTYKNVEKFVKLMKYYGIDGLGCNSEFRSNTAFMNEWIAFIRACKQYAATIDWEFQIHWYDGTNDNGSISFDRGLDMHNDGIFGTGAEPVTDCLFFNYNWRDSHLSNSVIYAEKMGRNSYDLYAGFDIQGRAMKNNTGWGVLKNNKISIGFWGAHAQSLIHQSATDDGTSDIAIQKAYLQKQELIFSGGNRNPALTPAIRNDATLANADLKTFHGLASLLTAKSTLQQLPFVTRFSLGNGQFFNNEGVTTFDHKWYNLNTQDFLPTWRWWITDRNDQVTEAGLPGLIGADFTFDDAWFGGSCLKLHGATDFSRVKLFKTKFEVQPDYTISVTYKMPQGTDPKAKVFVAKKGALTTYLEAALPAADAAGVWKTHTFTLSELGIAANDIVSMIGISLDGTSAGYELLLGELALRNPAQAFNTVTPTITKIDILRRRYNEVDFKLFYKSKDETNGVKTYNDEVGTWYYEIYMQQKDQPEQLLTATASWAGYVIDAPWVTEGSTDARFGVRAISPDGKQASPISWSAYQEVPYDSPIDDPVIDKPVVKPNEEFTIRYKDELHVPAQKWEIKDPITGETLAEASNSVQVTTKIGKVGLYDLYVTNEKGEVTHTCGFVQITPEETGAVPSIFSFRADKQEAKAKEKVNYSYTSRDGEGSVSRALRVADPDMFMVPADAQKGYEYSYAVWFKVRNFSHDKQGTNLINKNSIADKWPHNNWGDLWVTIRPTNEISFNTLGWTKHDVANDDMKSTGLVVAPNIWNHIVVTQDASKVQKMYFNGKKVAETTYSVSSRREDYSDSRIDKTQPAHITFGGGGVYKAGLDGWIDEVQVWNKVLTDSEVLEAMKGYSKAPDGLVAYYTFEEAVDGAYFANKGTGSADLKGTVVVLAGSGGESTTTASYEPVPFSNDELGYPGIPGSLPITTTAEWKLDGSVVSSSDPGTPKQVEVVYSLTGKYDAGLKLKNMWGTAEVNHTEYIYIGPASNINREDAWQLSVYPNPFVESVNMKFAEAGVYTVRVLNQAGQTLTESKLTVDHEAQVVNVSVDGGQGAYMLQVLKDGKLYRTLKLIKQ